MLRLLADADPAPALCRALESSPAGVDLDRYAANRNLDAAAPLWDKVGIIIVDEAARRIGFTAASWQALGERLLAALAEEHSQAPDMMGVGRDRLRRLTLPTLGRAAFDRLVGTLQADGRLAQTGGWLHQPGHRATLAAVDVEAWSRLRHYLDADALHPPRVRDIATATGIAEEKIRGLMKRLSRVGQVYPVALDHYFSAAAVGELAAHVDAICAREGSARAAALRDVIGGGRKVAIQILEFFDRVGYTRRVRDCHVRREPGAVRQWVLH